MPDSWRAEEFLLPIGGYSNFHPLPSPWTGSRAPAPAVLGPLWLASVENWHALTCLTPTPFFWGAHPGKGPHPPALPGWGAHWQPCPGAPAREQADCRSSCTPLRLEETSDSRALRNHGFFLLLRVVSSLCPETPSSQSASGEPLCVI